MCSECGTGHVCIRCMGEEICRRLDTHIAQTMRLSDLLERQTGYDNLPLFQMWSSPIINFDYQPPFFEIGAILQDIIVSTDATACNVGIYVYHPTLIGGKQQIAQFQGSGTFPPITGKITMPAKGYIGIRFAALSGGTFASLMASYSRSEQTGIEWMRSQRAGRQG